MTTDRYVAENPQPQSISELLRLKPFDPAHANVLRNQEEKIIAVLGVETTTETQMLKSSNQKCP